MLIEFIVSSAYRRVQEGKMAKAASKELSDLLDQISGIPKGKEEEARMVQRKALTGVETAEGPVQPLGIWWKGCYYTKNGDRGRWEVQYCVA